MMDRPYCLDELKDLESELHEKYRLSNVFAQHYPCEHRYRVKKGGRKEQFILDSSASDILDDQTCSVCFKLRTSVENNNRPSFQIIDNIKKYDSDDNDKKINIEFLRQKTHFYKWLFQHDY